jgi:uncharacterized protein
LKNCTEKNIDSQFFTIDQPSDCIARIKNSFIVGPKGELYKCCHDVGVKEKIYGNIKTGITNSEIYTKYMTFEDPLFDDDCKNCSLFPICSGGCPLKRIISPKDPTNCIYFKNNINDFFLAYVKAKKLNK